MIYLDFETRSAVNLKKYGATKYAYDKSTQVLCLCWAYDDEPTVHLWHRDHPWIEKSERPDELLERIAGGELIEAHNARFEFSVWNHALMREFPEFDIPLQIEQMRCSAAKASCLSLRRALGDALHDIGAPLEFQKDTEGKRLINILSKPTRRGFCEEEAEHRRNWDYCAQDIRAERYLSHWCDGAMTPRELEYWQMDFRMNVRGIKLDRKAAQTAIALCASEQERLDAEMQEITGGAVLGGKKRIPFRKWANEQIETINLLGLGEPMEPLPDTRADTFSFALYGVPTKAAEEAKIARASAMKETWDKRGEAGAALKRAMEISMEVNRSSVAKFNTMMGGVCPDGRLHDIMLYNGAARTGRWSGQGVQPQNFVRGYSKDMQDIWDWLLLDADPDLCTLITGEQLLPTLAKACRGALIASNGKELYAADFSAIEARKLAWMADCKSQLELFRSDGDPYIDMACGIYGLDFDATNAEQIARFKKEHPVERQLGKRCFAGNTLVLTERGLIPIIEVLATDRLWDGVEWVNHEGLVDRGVKEVCLFAGTWATPEHPVSDGVKWFPWESLEQDESISCRALEHASANLPSKDTPTGLAAVQLESLQHALVARLIIWFTSLIFVKDVQHDVMNAQRKLLDIGRSTIGAMPILCRTTRTGLGFLTEYPHASGDAGRSRLENVGVGSITVNAGFECGSLGVLTEENFSLIWSLYQDGITRFLNWIGRITKKGTSQEILDLLHAGRTWRIARPSLNCGRALRSWKNVYDIANAGPRRRFTIITDRGPLIVHNSVLGLGYQMSWEKFQLTVLAEEGIELDDEFCQLIVRTYRKKKCPEIPALWKAANEAAIEATLAHDGTEFRAGSSAGGVDYFMRGRFLHCRLPSGRLLAYLDPEVHTKIRWVFPAKNERGTSAPVTFPSRVGVPMNRVKRHAGLLAEMARKRLTGDPPESYTVPHLSFLGLNTRTRQWGRMGTFGGSLVENCLVADAEVLTPSGWKEIIRVKKSERVWDGVEWVEHAGLVSRGIRSVGFLDGVGMTPDHNVLTVHGWEEAIHAVSKRFHRAAVRLPNGFDPSSATFGPWDAIIYNSRFHQPTYDLMNCGPRHRFVVRGKTAPFLVHNCDQASSRDLLAEAMWRIDQDDRFDLLLSIHDEVIAEAPIGTCDVKEFETIMSEVPGWAEGMPIAAEGWKGLRLRK